MDNQENFQEVERQIITVRRLDKKDFEIIKKNRDKLFNKFIKPKISCKLDPEKLKRDAEKFKKSRIYLDFIANYHPVEKKLDNSFEAILLRIRERLRKNELKKARTIDY